jgi:hypothetical protein
MTHVGLSNVRQGGSRTNLLVRLLTSFAAVVAVMPMVFSGGGVMMGQECVEASQREAFRAAAIVFRGRILRIEDATSSGDVIAHQKGTVPYALSEAGSPKIVTLAVDRVWKGTSGATIHLFVLEHPPFGAGFQFHVGSAYVIYAHDELDPSTRPPRSGSKLYNIAVSCTPRVRSDVETESRLLGKGKAPK